mgnify:FL=1
MPGDIAYRYLKVLFQLTMRGENGQGWTLKRLLNHYGCHYAAFGSGIWEICNYWELGNCFFKLGVSRYGQGETNHRFELWFQLEDKF